MRICLQQFESMEQEAAKAAARRLFKKVSFAGGALQSYEVSSLLTDTYQYLKIRNFEKNLAFKPTSKDIKGYSEVLDTNKDGQVTLEDLQQLAVQCLTGPGVLSSHSIDRNYKTKKLETSGVSSSSFGASLVGTGYGTTISKGDSKVQQNLQVLNIPEKQYNQQTLSYLAATKEIFKTHADSHFTITADSVAGLLGETYQVLGRKGYQPSPEDVRVWMRLCDGNGDGHVEYAEYEYFVARSLERSGMEIYQ